MQHRIHFFLAIALLLAFQSFAQRPGGGMPGGALNIGRIYGKLLDSVTKEPMPYASVVLLGMKGDSIISGTLTKGNGYFDLSELGMGMYRLKITNLGYKEIITQVKIMPQKAEQDLGNFMMELDENTLQQVTVTGEKSTAVLAVDRRTYNVDKNLTATGGTAIDALKIIPSVSVDSDGNVELRNSAPRIFVDGKPSPLTLEQIPASEIDRIEVITNPSAKYDASATGGILNIVLKKNKMPGIFAMINAGGGLPERGNGMVNLNIRQNPFNFNISYNINSTYSNPRGYAHRTNLENGVPVSYFNQDGLNTGRRTFQFGRAGLEYSINNRNMIGGSVTLTGGNMNFGDQQTFLYLDANKTVTGSGERTSDAIRKIGNQTYQLDYKRTYPTEGREWTTFLQYNVGKNNGTNYINSIDDLSPTNNQLIESNGENSTNTLQFQSDYTLPKGANQKWELGARAQYKANTSFTDAYATNSSGVREYFNLLSNKYDYDEWIAAAYTSYSTRIGTWSYQFGLRLEQSVFTGSVPGSDSSFNYSYPSALSDAGNLMFPSFFMSKEIKEGRTVQFNLSRKLERPNFFQIMPFVWQEDNQNYRAGNPNLRPEFRYLAEANYSHTFGKGSWFTSLYGRYSDNPITHITERANDGSAALISTSINGNASLRMGWENNIKYKVLTNVEVGGGINLSRQEINATVNGIDTKNTGWAWEGKSNIDWKINKKWNFQTNGEYESPRIIAQGTTIPQWRIDAALKYTLNPMCSFTLSVNDIFNSNGRGQIIDNELFTQETFRRREVRSAQLVASLRLGKPDATLFKKLRSGRSSSGGGEDDY